MKKCFDCKEIAMEGHSRCKFHFEKKKAYFQRPDVKEKKRDAVALKKIIRKYHYLLSLKNPSVMECRRLEAIAEYLGRDIDEWRNKRQREEYQNLLGMEKKVIS